MCVILKLTDIGLLGVSDFKQRETITITHQVHLCVIKAGGYWVIGYATDLKQRETCCVMHRVRRADVLANFNA